MTEAEATSGAASQAAAPRDDALSPSVEPPRQAPRFRLDGIDLIRTIAVAAVIYSHISFFLIDDRGTGWWLIDAVYQVFVKFGHLNQHLSFLGVSFFMVVTGALVTGAATRESPRSFFTKRLVRLVPLFWVAIAVAIVLVRLHVNGMFSPQAGVSNAQAALSFFLGNFFLRPEVAVLGVAWTLVVQICFYLYCMALRPVLRRNPVAVPMLGAALCAGLLVYNHAAPPALTIPMLTKVATTMPAVFIGQLMYLGWTRRAARGWLIVAGIAQLEVVHLAGQLHEYWAGDRYLQTVLAVIVCVLVLAKRNGPIARSRVVHWVGTRSYAIYLVHTLVLYRVFDLVVGRVGTTCAVLAMLVVTGVVSEAGYRWIEMPAARWLTARLVQTER